MKINILTDFTHDAYRRFFLPNNCHAITITNIYTSHKIYSDIVRAF